MGDVFWLLISSLGGLLLLLAACVTMYRINQIKTLLAQHLQFQIRVLQRLDQVESHTKKTAKTTTYLSDVTAEGRGEQTEGYHN